jgi:hypothetical protein
MKGNRTFSSHSRAFPPVHRVDVNLCAAQFGELLHENEVPFHHDYRDVSHRLRKYESHDGLLIRPSHDALLGSTNNTQ